NRLLFLCGALSASAPCFWSFAGADFKPSLSSCAVADRSGDAPGFLSEGENGRLNTGWDAFQLCFMSVKRLLMPPRLPLRLSPSS
ncbi:hypothetical protein KEM55_000392, partial [Ascosphaera atra]